MRALDRKLFRDLGLIKGQALAIAMVIAAGVAMYLMALSAFDSLELTQRTYYDRQRFAEVFAGLKRAPLRLERRIAEIPGVAQVETRVVVDVNLDVPGVSEPAMGRLISIPENRRPLLNDVFLTEGRYIEPDRADEVLVSENFARAHGLHPGDDVAAIINGRRRNLEIVGLALSPEYVYSIRPGELFPDDLRFGLFWMGRKALGTAFDMEGGFNDVALSLRSGTREQEVIARLDRLLETYGGLGAIPRALQTSHWYLESELTSLQGLGAIVPIIFLGVAAFLLNVVLSRIIQLQREQIAALKALGYSNFSVAMHYIKWALVISVIGCFIGIGGGVWLGSAMTRLYTQFFQFPILEYRLLPSTVVEAVVISLIAAVVGALGAVRRAVNLPPAEAMRPEPPADYRVSFIERAGLRWLFSQPTRMIYRNLQRNPWRASMSVLGIAFGGAMLIVGSFSYDAVEEMLDLQFNVAQRYDIMISFVEPRSSGSLYEARRLPGVIDAEAFRAVPVRFRFGHRHRQSSITALPDDARLNRVVDASFAVKQLPPDGLVLSSKLAELLGAERGDRLTVEVLEGARPVLEVPVTDLVEEYMGTSAYMNHGALQRLMREGRNLSGAYLQVDAAAVDVLYERLKRLPAVAGVMLKVAAIRSFRETLGESMGIFRMFNIMFAAIIAFGVVYNSARISLSERSRELATLRVIGFTRAEISYILLGELAVLTFVAVPLGLLLGYGLSALTIEAYDTEVYRIPLVVAPRTLALTAITVLVSAVISGWVVRKRLDRLDLVAVLKTRE
jgi:putative ABC transport system permease protein